MLELGCALELIKRQFKVFRRHQVMAAPARRLRRMREMCVECAVMGRHWRRRGGQMRRSRGSNVKCAVAADVRIF